MLGLVGLGFPGSGQAQERVRLGIRQNFGVSLSRVPQVAPANWQERYQPPGGSMQLERDDFAFFWDAGPVAELPVPIGGSWEVDLVLSYYVTVAGRGERGSLTIKKTVAVTTVDWWNDVSLLEVKLTKTTPAIGFGLRSERWRLQFDVQRYRLSIQEFRGIDRPGRPNTADVTRERVVGTGLGFRVGVSRLAGRRWTRAHVGGYCEAAGTAEQRVVLCGISLDGLWPPGR